MNKQRRKELTRIYNAIESLKDDLENIMCEEQESLDNMPESLQYSERGEQMTEYIKSMDNTLDCLNDALDYIDEVINN